jgi:hypothetical protein
VDHGAPRPRRVLSRNLQPTRRTAQGTDPGADQRDRPQVRDRIQIGRLNISLTRLGCRVRNRPITPLPGLIEMATIEGQPDHPLNREDRCPWSVAQDRSPSQAMWPDRLVGRHIIVARRNNSAHLHRPWRPRRDSNWATALCLQSGGVRFGSTGEVANTFCAHHCWTCNPKRGESLPRNGLFRRISWDSCPLI